MQIHSNFFKKKRWTRLRTSSSVTICLNRVCSMLVQLVNSLIALKPIIFIFLGLGEKKAQRHIHGYVTNQMRGSQFATSNTNWEGCWLKSSSVYPHDEDQEDGWSQNPTVHTHNNFFKRKRWTRARTSSSVTICLNRVCSKLVQLVNTLSALKLILLYV